MLKLHRLGPGKAEHRPQKDARGKVAQHRPKAKPNRHRHQQNRCAKVEAGLEEKVLHQTPSGAPRGKGKVWRL
ncbi:hypothetical protein MASR1M32_18610 [Rhodobacter sp.]